MNVSNGFLDLANMNTEEISKIHKTELSVPSSTSCTGSWPGFSRSPKHGSSVEMSAMDSLTSKTYIIKRSCEEMNSYDSFWDTIITMSSNTSFTGSWSGFSRSTELASSVCLSPLDSPPSKHINELQNLKFFCVFLEKNTKNVKTSRNSWQGYVKMTSPRQLVTSYQGISYTVMCGTKFWEKSPKEFLKSVMVQELCSKK